MSTTITFKVEDDRGNPVKKTRSLAWIKDYIKSSYESRRGHKIGAFVC